MGLQASGVEDAVNGGAAQTQGPAQIARRPGIAAILGLTAGQSQDPMAHLRTDSQGTFGSGPVPQSRQPLRHEAGAPL